MLLFFVLLLIAFFTYKLLIVLKNKEVPGNNILYVFSVAGIIAAGLCCFRLMFSRAFRKTVRRNGRHPGTCKAVRAYSGDAAIGSNRTPFFGKSPCEKRKAAGSE